MTDQAGFSLMEALVALAVFSTAAVGMISLNTNSVRISGHMDERALARQVAENVAVDTVTDSALQIIGRTTGKEAQRRQTFEWERVISPAPREDLVQVDIQVKVEGADGILAQVSLLHRLERAP